MEYFGNIFFRSDFMRHRHGNILINFILLISLLLSGMCFNDFQTDSRFTCHKSSQTISNADSLSHSEELCTLDLLENIQNVYVRHGKSYQAPTIRQISFICIHNIFSDTIYHSDYISRDEQSGKQITSNRIIISYIHQKDGSKA